MQGMDTRLVFTLALAAALLPGLARAEELPRSTACHAALQALGDAEDALGAAWAASAASAPAQPDAERQRRISAQLFPQRQRVADACLGGVPRSPARAATPPGPVPAGPVTPRPGFLPAPMPTPTPAPIAPPRVQGPLTVGPCNAATCVTSDGSTLTRVGPHLVGPRGLCTVQGTVLICP